MILLRVAHKSEERIREITRYLLKEHLIIDANIEVNVERLSYTDGEFVTQPICILTATTKSLLFTLIDVKLVEMYPGDLIEIYAVPIVHMDFEQRRHLLDEVKTI